MARYNGADDICANCGGSVGDHSWKDSPDLTPVEREEAQFTRGASHNPYKPCAEFKSSKAGN